MSSITFTTINSGNADTINEDSFASNEINIDKAKSLSLNVQQNLISSFNTISNTNHAPIAFDDFKTLNEDSTINSTVSYNVNDPDHGASLTYSLNTPVPGLTFNPNGSYTFDASNIAYQHLAMGNQENIVVNYTVTDEHGASSIGKLTITLRGTNDAPVAVADTNSGDAGTTISGSVATNDSDVDDGAILTFSLNAPVAGLTFNPDGSYTFDAGNAAYQRLSLGGQANIVINYTVTDEHGASAASTLTLTIVGVNDTPKAVDNNNNVNKDDTAGGAAADNAGNGGDGSGMYGSSSGLAGLTTNQFTNYNINSANVLNQNVAMSAPRGSSGSIASDQSGNTLAGTSDVNSPNHAPVAVADTNNVNEHDTLTGSLATNDSDPDSGSILKYGLITPVAGLIVNADGSYSFDAGNNMYHHLATGEKQIVIANYIVFDQHFAFDTSTLTITITGVNDPAELSTDIIGLKETNSAADISTSGTLTISDVDSVETFVAQSGVNGNYGTFSIDANGAWTYTANDAHNEFSDGVDYIDKFDVFSADGTKTAVIIHIEGTNDPAILSSDTRNLTEGDSIAAISTSGTLTISDIDSPSLFVEQINTLGLYGTFNIDASGAWTYVPNLPHNEFEKDVVYQESFTVFSIDGTPTVVNINITGTNDPATLIAQTVDLNEGNTAADISTTGVLTISDVDSPEFFIPQTNTNGIYGNFSIDDNGNWNYVANSAHNEFVEGNTYQEVFSISSVDGTLTSVTINLIGTDDLAILSSDIRNLTESSTVADISSSGILTLSDVDSSENFVPQLSTAGVFGSFSIDANGAWTYTASTPHDEFKEGQTYQDNFDVYSSDGAHTTVSINILGTNDAPVAVADVAHALEDTTVTGFVSFNDTDVDQDAILNYSLNAPVVGLSFGTDGSYTFNGADAAYQHLAMGQNEAVIANYTVTDEHGASDTSTLTITLTGINDTPVALADSNSGYEDSNISGSVALNDSDVDDGAILKYSLNTAVDGLSLSTDGTYNFDASNAAYQHLAAGEQQIVVANYTVTDEHGAFDSSTLTITLTGVNDPANLSMDVIHLVEGDDAKDISTNGMLTISDIDSPETFVAQSGVNGNYGIFSVDTSGAWVYTATDAHNEFVDGVDYIDNFKVFSADGTGTSVDIHILGTNEAGTTSTHTGFVSGSDYLSFSKATINVNVNSSGSILDASDFVSSVQNETPISHFIFDSATSTLYYDADASAGNSSPVPIATLPAGTTLTATDIHLF